MAAAIHARSPRNKREMKSVNCSDDEGELVRSALFGHVNGALTGADREQEGNFDIADGSTLFLDEVAELGPQAPSATATSFAPTTTVQPAPVASSPAPTQSTLAPAPTGGDATAVAPLVNDASGAQQLNGSGH